VALGVVASVAAASSGLAPTAGADGLLPTTTTVTASPATSTAGTAVTVTATVNLLGVLPGLAIVPTGPVAFSATNGSTTTPLGTADLGFCLLTACTASITTTAIPAGSTSVTASYAGDTLAAASTGAAAVTVTAPPPPPPEPDVQTTKVCTTGKTCSTSTITSSDGLTSLQVTATGGNQSVFAALYDEGTLHCPGRAEEPPGALAEFDNSSPTGAKTVNIRWDGTVARDMKIAYNQHPSYLGCYGSPTPFNGYTNGVYGPATFSAEDGLYVAQLPSCTASGGQKPCFEWQSNYNFDSNTGTSKLTIFTPPGDPKYI
jgi:hypothetical protein